MMMARARFAMTKNVVAGSKIGHGAGSITPENAQNNAETNPIQKPDRLGMMLIRMEDRNNISATTDHIIGS